MFFQARKQKEEEDKKREYDAYLARKQEEEEEEERIERETDYQLNAAKAALANNESNVNMEIMNLLEHYNGLKTCLYIYIYVRK